MVDPDSTPPEGMPAEDRPTSPDLATFPCPWCQAWDEEAKKYVSLGMVLDRSEWSTRYSAVAKQCEHCRGQKVVDRVGFAKWQAQRQGRNR